MSQRALGVDSYEMIVEEEEGGETAKDNAASSWEDRAEQLYSLCDRECKGFITKRDLQRLWGELPLGPDELEGVFDSLDQDGNGFLTLQEFTDGFGHHLGLVVEFMADCDSVKGSEAEEEEEKEDDNQSATESGSITSQQIDGILSCFAKHDFNISSTMVETVWRDVCQGDDATEGSSLGRLVAALLHELSRVKAEQTHLEAALNTKTEQYNLQVSRLYEELESQITGERSKVAAEHSVKGARALASLEEEVRDRETAFRILHEDHAALIEKVERLTAADLAAKQDNIRLSQHLNKLEQEFSIKETEVEELSATVDHLRKNTKDDKRRRVQQAIKVSEGISLERESLVTQLDFLRTINTHLRDEHDQSNEPTPNASNRSRNQEDQEQVTVSAPIAARRTTVNIAVASISEDLQTPPHPNTLPLLGYDGQERMSPDGSHIPTDFEHDESYFQNSTWCGYGNSVLPISISSPTTTETSLLQELLQQPNLCTSCGGKVSNQSDENATSTPKVTFERTDSITQTSPTLLMSKEQQLEDFASEVKKTSSSLAKSPDVVMPAKMIDESSETQHRHPEKEDTTTSDVIPKSCHKILKDPDVTKNCYCQRNGSQPEVAMPNHSSTMILYHPGQPLPPDLLPKKHSTNAYIHTQHKHHSHAYLPVKHLQSQSTCTHTDHFQNQDSQDAVDSCLLAAESEIQDAVGIQSVVDGEDLGAEIADAEAQNMANGTTTDMYMNSSDISKSEMNSQNQPQRHRTTNSSLLDEKINNLRNLKDNIKSYITDKSQVFTRENRRESENGVDTEIPVTPVTTTRVFKIVFIGDSSVGKTTFIHRASIGEFRNDFAATVGVDYRLMEICVGGVRALLQLWDTAGQERYRAITRQYYRKADGVVVMYDVTNERSYLNVVDWISSVREYGDGNLVMAIIGNKKDLKKARQVNIDVAYKLSKAHNSLMYECSAATGSGVKEAMKHLAGILTTDQEHEIDTSATVTLHHSPKSSKKCC